MWDTSWSWSWSILFMCHNYLLTTIPWDSLTPCEVLALLISLNACLSVISLIILSSYLFFFRAFGSNYWGIDFKDSHSSHGRHNSCDNSGYISLCWCNRGGGRGIWKCARYILQLDLSVLTYTFPKRHNTTQYNTVQYNTIQYNTIQYNTMRLIRYWCRKQYNTIQYNTIQYNTIQYNTIQYDAVDKILM